jgi:4-hydroxythreonine-4-phosphate dehydrogenase
VDIITRRATYDENRANPLKKLNPEVFARMEDEEIREGN